LKVLWEKNQQQLKRNVYFYTFLRSHVNKAIWHFEAVLKYRVMTHQRTYLLTGSFLFYEISFGDRHIIYLQIKMQKLKGRGVKNFAILDLKWERNQILPFFIIFLN